MAADAFEEIPPESERLTVYDEAHLTTYLRLLDAEEEGADWCEVARIVFGLDVAADPDRAKRIHDSHLARARWMTEAGYRQLLKPRMR